MISKNISHSVFARSKMVQMHALTFQTAEKGGRNSVVIRSALVGYALADTEVSKTLTVSVGGILNTTIKAKDGTN